MRIEFFEGMACVGVAKLLKCMPKFSTEMYDLLVKFWIFAGVLRLLQRCEWRFLFSTCRALLTCWSLKWYYREVWWIYAIRTRGEGMTIWNFKDHIRVFYMHRTSGIHAVIFSFFIYFPALSARKFNYFPSEIDIPGATMDVNLPFSNVF